MWLCNIFFIVLPLLKKMFQGLFVLLGLHYLNLTTNFKALSQHIITSVPICCRDCTSCLSQKTRGMPDSNILGKNGFKP